jgi:hypothetical protein
MRQIVSMQKVVITFAFGEHHSRSSPAKAFEEERRHGALRKAQAAAF